MVSEEGISNRDGVECTLAIKGLKSKAVNKEISNKVVNDVAEGILGSNGVLRTYKRRKLAKLSLESKVQDNDRVYVEAASQLADQTLKEPRDILRTSNSCEEVPISKRNMGLDDCPQSHWRNVVLEHVYQSLKNDEGGVKQCIQDALTLQSGKKISSCFKKFDGKDEDRLRCISNTFLISNGSQKEATVDLGVLPNGSLEKSNHFNRTEKCQLALFNVIVSQKFTSLCDLLFENFGGIKADTIFDFSLINSRMREGAYEHSPALFSSDIQQVWRKLQGIGTELVSLAVGLSDLSRSACREQLCVWESDSNHGAEQTEDHNYYYNISSCRHCGGKADVKDCLVCDSCEEMFHVSCIEPAVKEIPHKSWYCGSCTASGIGSPHENCVVCERLNAPRAIRNGVGREILPTSEHTYQVDDISNCSTDVPHQRLEGSENLFLCKICGNNVENGEKFRKCSHLECQNKCYHMRCLTSKQLKSYGPRWYCPSCLCRVCFTDRDDDKIVLCDGCDHGYHIYCLRPPLASIPEGNWFCRRCNAGIQAIRKAKKAYEKFENKQIMEKLADKDANELDKGRGGMDMLLTAAKTLNYEEKLAALNVKS